MFADVFREEVLLAQRGEWLGSIRLPAPRPGWIFFGFGLLAIVAILALLVGEHYTRHEQDAGTLVPTSGLLALTPIVPDIVTHVLVHDGDLVRAGQRLLEISGAQDSASLGDTQFAIAAQLQVKRSRLQADLNDQQNLEGQRLAAFLLFVFFGHNTHSEIVTGQLLSSTGTLNIATPSMGRIARLHVHGGEFVGTREAPLEVMQTMPSLGLALEIAFGRNFPPISIEKLYWSSDQWLVSGQMA